MKRIPFPAPFLLLLFLWFADSAPAAGPAATYREPWRPRFHFTPAVNWMNDPNGMVWYDGEYHLFYQFNPAGIQWGHMSWGHAVSRDLVHWEHLPLALPEEDGVMIFSGSAVVDWKNTSGFGRNGRPPLVAIYTGHRDRHQDQRLAYSNDRGRSWTKFPGNPVLDVNMADFRDPKVFWHEATSRWILVLALSAEKKVHFYASDNLRQWKYVGEFGGAGSTEGLWECPDLFPLAAPGGGVKWVLVVNVNPGGPTGGSGCQYFVGDFDGSRFQPDGTATRWADHGADFYAGVSWSDVPKSDGRRLWLGWMSNWAYANDVPTTPWRSAMSVPRELGLRATPDGLRLAQQPVRELRRLRGAAHRLGGASFGDAARWLAARRLRGELLELEGEFDMTAATGDLTLRITTAPGEETVLRRSADGRLTLDRTRSGRADFHPKFAAVHETALPVRDGRITLHLFLDTSSLEVFGNNGEVVLTDLILPAAGPRKLELLASNGTGPHVKQLRVWELRSAWK